MEDKALVEKLAAIKKKLKIPSWYRQTVLVARFHRLCQKAYGVPHRTQGKSGWGLRDTAETLQIHHMVVQKCVKAMKIIKTNPDFRHLKSQEDVFRRGGRDASSTK